MSKIAVIDYGSGNLRSVVNAVRAAANELGRESDIMLAATADELSSADSIILPGVGHFADCRSNLAKAQDMEQALSELVHEKAVPFLGICVGMQMLADAGHEGQVVEGLSWISGDVHKLTPQDSSLKIPHMGWNQLHFAKSHPVTSYMAQDAQVYFVHSYHFKATDEADILATADYGEEIVSIVAKDNIIGTQFHPEKSQQQGQAFLRGFLDWRP